MSKKAANLTVDSTASDIVEQCMMEYCAEISEDDFPHEVDGLKKVQRRILTVLGKSTTFIKSLNPLGAAVALHGKGDDSLYDAMTRLMQSFKIGIPLVDSQGHAGTYYDSKAAAPRYLETASHEFARDLLFHKTNPKTIKMVRAIDGKSMEPLYYVPRLPLALLVHNTTVGIAYSSRTHPLSLANLCHVLKDYIKQRGLITVSNPIDPEKFISKHKTHLIPEYPNDGTIRNPQSIVDCKEDEVIVNMDGIMKVFPNHIDVITLPYGKPSFKDLKERIIDKVKDKKHWFHKEIINVENLSSKRTGPLIRVTFKRNTDIFALLDHFKREIGFNGSIRSIPMFITKDCKLRKRNVYQLIDIWYIERYRVMYSGIKYELNKEVMTKLKLTALDTVKNHIDEVVQISKNSNTDEEFAQGLIKRFQITRQQAEIVSNMSLKQITRGAKADLAKQILDNERDLSNIRNKFNRVPELIIEDIDYFLNKYGNYNKHKTIVRNYIGAVFVGSHGVIQFETMNEVKDIVSRFKNITGIEIYPKSYKYKWLYSDRSCLFDDLHYTLSKECYGSKFIYSNNKDIQHLFIANKGFSYVRKEMVSSGDNEVVSPVSDPTLAISLKGDTYLTTMKEIGIKSVRGKGANNLLGYALPHTVEEYVVFYMNYKKPNHLYISRIKPGDNIDIRDKGKLRIVLVHPIADKYNDVSIILPEDIMSRTTINSVYIDDVSKFDTYRVINVNSTTNNRGISVKHQYRHLALVTLK